MKFEKGQSLVEMVFGFIVLILIVSGVVDIGRWYFTTVAMEDAVGEAALYYSALPGCVDESSGPNCLNPNNALYRAQGGANNNKLLDFENATVTLSCYTLEDKEPLDCVTEAKAMDVVEVHMEYPFKLLSSAIPEIAGGSTITLRSTATQIIVSDN